MNDQNQNFYTGRLTRDPEVKVIPNGSEVANFSIAVNEQWKKDGERMSKVVYIDLDVWGPQINFVRNYLHKGDLVQVECKYAPNVTETDDGRRVYPKFVLKEVRKFSWDKREDAPEREEETSPAKVEDKPKRTRRNRDVVVDDIDATDIPF
jgi:single-strand DNA-binding protein